MREREENVYLVIILSGGLLLGLTQKKIPIGASDEISKSKLIEKYNASQTIKSKYQLDGAALTRVSKNDPRDTIKVQLGDKNASEFIPMLLIS